MRTTTKVWIGLLAVAVLAAGTIAYAVDRTNRAGIEERVEGQMESLAQAQSNRVLAIVDQNEERFHLVSSRTQLRLSLDAYIETGDPAERDRMARILDDAVASLPVLRQIDVLAPNGTVVASTQPLAEGEDRASTQAFVAGREELRPDLYYRRDTGALGLRIAGPLSLGGEPIGVLVMDVAAAALTAVTGDYSGMGMTGETALALRSDDRAVFIAPLRFDADATMQRNVSAQDGTPVARALFGGHEGFTSGRDYRGVDVVASTRHLESLDWALVVKMDESEAMAGVGATRVSLAWTLGLALAVLGVGSWAVLTSTATRLHTLGRTSRRLGRGELDARTGMGGGDDLGRLGRTLDDMAAALQAKTEDLEEQVERRTRELRQTRSERDRFFDMSLELLCVADFDGRFVQLNPAWTETLGWSEAELKARPFLDFIHPDDREKTAEEAARLEHEDTSVAFVNRFATQDGAYRWLQWQSRADPADRLIYAVARDITVQKEAQEAMQEAKDVAERSARARSEFLANMSHEIRTPLNAILGTSALLEDSRLDEEQRHHMDVIQRGGEHLLTLLNDILDLSKIEAGRLELDETAFPLRDCIESALDLVAPAAADKSIELAYRMRGVPEAVRADPGRLRQILVNLLNNAVKFTEEGEVVLTVQPAEQGRIGFQVRDTGIGITKEEAERLFGAFTQADAGTTRKHGGTGLGLAICKHLVDAMGGTIEATGEPGEGSTFTFEVPLPADDMPVPLPWRDPPTQMRGLRVLVVDDNSTNLEIITHHLEAWGMRPVAHGEPQPALEAVRGGQGHDVAILDGQTPGMGGDELAMALHASAPGLPVVLLTSVMTSRRDLGEAADHFASILHKPVKPSRLYDALVAAVEGGSADRAEAAPRLDRDMATRLPLRILLAEDNLVNQRVTVRMLERLGYEPDVATDGQEVLDAVARNSYDVVFMDVQMPGMDGLEATRRLRAEGQRVRIVGLTAHAGPENRKMAEQAGMDDYLTKPVAVHGLVNALRRAGRPRGGGRGDGRSAKAAEGGRSKREKTGRQRAARAGDDDGQAPGSGNHDKQAPDGRIDEHATPGRGTGEQPTPGAGIDDEAWDRLVRNVGGDMDVVRELAGLFSEDLETMLEAIEAAVERDDARALERAAHPLKSSARNMGARELGGLCARLEQAGRAGQTHDAAPVIPSLRQEAQAALEGIEARLDGSGDKA